MTTLLGALAAVIAVGAAVRSTWSPCGLSMLSTLTPLGEAGRGRRWGPTAAWFVVGAVAGGLSLGVAMAGFATVVATFHLSPIAAGAAGLVACLVAAASDGRLGRFSLPVHHRQVNERWLDGYRAWVYGTGFGWQIGAGLVTYVTTAAVYLTIVLAGLSGDPAAALAVGALFGTVRGLAVLLGRPLTSTGALQAFHRRFAQLEKPVAVTLVGLETLAGLVLAATLWTTAGAAAAAVGVTAIGSAAAVSRYRRPIRVPVSRPDPA